MSILESKNFFGFISGIVVVFTGIILLVTPEFKIIGWIILVVGVIIIVLPWLVKK